MADQCWSRPSAPAPPNSPDPPLPRAPRSSPACSPAHSQARSFSELENISGKSASVRSTLKAQVSTTVYRGAGVGWVDWEGYGVYGVGWGGLGGFRV